MIIFLYGPDDYRRLQKKKEIIAEFEKKHRGFGRGDFDFMEEDGLYGFRDFMRAQSIFDPAKLAIIENAFEAPDKELKPILLEALALPRVTALIVSGEKPKAAFKFLLQAPAIAQEFEVLKGKSFEVFVAKEAEKQSIKFASDALQFIAQVYEGNTWGLVMEIQKIAGVEKRIITKKELEGLGLETTPDFWQTLYGLKSNVLRERMSALEKTLAEAEPAAKLFNILGSMWHEKIQRVAEYDLLIKSGKLDYEEALVDLVCS